ncbi:MAG TPA: ABC transporter ATP-binding protein [Acetobacteraceae bacterium]|nr:ABC transporter ATP-binding protein [Acetobacteraceae bacterium]
MNAAPSLSVLLRYRHRPIGFLLHYVRRHAAAHAVVLGSVFFAVVFAVSTQYGLKRVIDVVSHGPTAAGAAVWGAFALLCALIAADNMTWRIGGFAAARAFVAVTGDVRSDLFLHLAGHSPSYFAERLPGALAGRITATSNAIYQTESTMTWNVIPPSLAVCLAIILIATVNPLMAGGLVLVAGGLATLIFKLAGRGTARHRAYANAAAAVDGELVDVISNMPVVRAFGATFREHRRINAEIGAEMQARRTSLYYLERLRLLHAAMTALLTAGLLGWGIHLWQIGQASAGDLVLICSLGFTILHGTRDLAVALVDLTQQVARLEEAIGALLVPHDLPDRADARPLLPGRGRVVFDHVRFAYPKRDAVLNDLTLTIEPGQRVGLVGASGAGKSTVLALLQRFYDVQGGRILLDGQDIAQITQQSLRETVAVVPQDISMFHRTVLENIRYGRPDATEAEVLAAATVARCRDFIEELPDGFETMVGDRGVKLSGGQRQRLAIARALLKDAPILLLDEATSALDSESEAAIQVALDNLMRGRTVIAIAHRLSTLRNFDRIVVMEAGRVIDDGTPLELAHRPGPYRDLLRKQMHTLEELPAVA